MTSQAGFRDWPHLNYDISTTWLILKERAYGQGDHETAATEKEEKTAIIGPQVGTGGCGTPSEAGEGGCGRSWYLSLCGSFPSWHRATKYLAFIHMQKISSEFKLLTFPPKCQGNGPSPRPPCPSFCLSPPPPQLGLRPGNKMLSAHPHGGWLPTQSWFPMVRHPASKRKM